MVVSDAVVVVVVADVENRTGGKIFLEAEAGEHGSVVLEIIFTLKLKI